MIGGIDFIPVAIGLFGLGELFYAFYEGRHASGSGGIVQYQKERRFWPELRDWIETRVTMVRASLLGFAIGVIPGAGATIASLMAYSVEKSAAKQPERFGKGAMAGLVGPEAANNAASAGAMVPLLTLGIPGSASTAVLLAAFLLWGLRPGPLLMSQNPEFAWGLIASMYLGNLALVLLNIFAIPRVRPDAARALPDPGAGRDRALHDRHLQRERQHRRDLDHVRRRHRRLLHEAVRLLAGGGRPGAGPGARLPRRRCARRSRSRAAPLRSSSSARCRSGSSAITLAILLAAPLLRRFQSRAA